MSTSQIKKSKNNNNLRNNRENDPFAMVERAADLIWQRSEEAIKNGEVTRISDEAVSKIMTAAVKLYSAKADGEQRTFRPLLGNFDEVVTPTEALTSVTEILRSLELGPMEFGLWSRRKPEDYHNTSFDDKIKKSNLKINK